MKPLRCQPKLVILLFAFNAWIQISNAYATSAGFSNIQQAIQKGNLEALKQIQNFPTHATDRFKRTLLHWAVSYEKPEITAWLIHQKKASVNALTVIGKTPLHIAALRKNTSLAKILIKAGGDIQNLDHRKNSLLHYVFYSQKKGEKKHFEMVRFLLDRKIKVNTQNNSSDTALHLAVAKADLGSVILLLKSGAKVELSNMYRQTPIHQILVASRLPENYKKLISEMLKQKFPIDLKDNSGKTILHYASEKGLLDIVKQVVNRKAHLNMQTPEGWTPLHLASVNSHFPVIRFLVDQGADVNIQDKEGSTPLYFAVGSGNKRAVAFLLKAKARVFWTDKAGKSLFDDKTRAKLKELLTKFRRQEKDALFPEAKKE